MHTPLFGRPRTADEWATLETGLRSSSACTVRRCQSLLTKAEGQATTTIASHLPGPDQTVRHTLHACHQRGLAALQPQSSRPHTTSASLPRGGGEALRALWPQSPRTFGKPTSRGPRARAAEGRLAEGLTPRLGSAEAMRVALRRLRVSGKRAHHWITRPEPAYARKQNGAPS